MWGTMWEKLTLYVGTMWKKLTLYVGTMWKKLTLYVGTMWEKLTLYVGTMWKKLTLHARTTWKKLTSAHCSLILDNERWKQADVPAEFQDLVDHISATGTQHHCYETRLVINNFSLAMVSNEHSSSAVQWLEIYK